MATELKPIVEKSFKYSKLVVCGKCHGAGEIFNGKTEIECPVCLGASMLHRVSEGIVKLYTVK
jgi:hypothetical protein